MLAEDEDGKRRRPEKRRFRVPAKLEDVLSKVLDGVEPPREPEGPKLPERYVLIDEIGRGAQSHVYAVFDRELNCKSALKIFNDGGGGRGHREAQSLSGVEHANVVRVQDVGLYDGRVYLRMEFVDGSTLGKWVADRRWREKLAAYIQAGRGLAAAHKNGIVHRDFKPENALVRESDNRVVVVDFGLARGMVEAAEAPKNESPPSASTSQAFLDPISRSGQMQGTPAYMAPEQFNRGEIDQRTDQFSFCVALYEALDGRRPFAGKTLPELARAVTLGEIRGAPRNTPPWVWRVLRRGLAVDPAERYASMDALLDDLENDPRKWFIRIVAVAAGLSAVAGAWWFWQAREQQHAAEQAQLQAEADAERLEKLAAEKELDDRSDNLTFRQAQLAMEDDPTTALAMLKNLKDDSEQWEGGVRMLAADAQHRGVAQSVIELGEAQVPHGLSPDGTIAVTREPSSREVSLHWIDDGKKRLLGVATGLPVVTFSPDGRFIAAQRVPEGVNLWKMPSVDEPAMPLGPSPIEHHRMLFGAGDPGVVTFGRDPNVFRWHDGGQQILGGHVDRVEAVAVDSAGKRAATVDGARRLRLWDLATTEARLVKGFAPIAFSPQGSLAVSDRGPCGDADEPTTLLRIVDSENNAAEALCADDKVPLVSMAFSPGGGRVAGVLANGRVRVWDLGTEETIDLERPDGEVGELRFTTDDTLGSKSPDTTLVVWVLPGERPHVLRGHGGIAHWAQRPDGDLVTFGHEGRVRLWSLPPRTDRPLRAHRKPVTHVAYAGTELVTAGKDGSVRAWPLGGGEGRVVADGAGPVVAMAVSPDSRRIAVGRAKGEVVVVDLAGGEAKVIANPEGELYGLAWNREGRQIALAGQAGGVDILDAASGDVQTEVRADDGFKVRSVHFNADGAAITTAGWVEDGLVSIRRFDASSGAVLQATNIDSTGVQAVAFSADDRYVAVTSFERAVIVWDAASGARVFGTHAGLVGGVAFSADSRRLVTAGEDGVVKLWEVGSASSRTISMRRPLRAVAFSPDGETFAAVGDARVAFFGRDDLPQDAAGLRQWVEAATDLRVDETR